MIIDGFTHQLPDTDPDETTEWMESLDTVISAEGAGRRSVSHGETHRTSASPERRRTGLGQHPVHKHDPRRSKKPGSLVMRISSDGSVALCGGTPP